MLPETLRWLVYALACWRVTRLLVYDAGPYDVLERLRAWAGVRVGYGNPSVGVLGRLLACPHCVGVWVAAGAVVCWALRQPVLDVLAAWWALAGVVSLLQELAER